MTQKGSKLQTSNDVKAKSQTLSEWSMPPPKWNKFARSWVKHILWRHYFSFWNRKSVVLVFRTPSHNLTNVYTYYSVNRILYFGVRHIVCPEFWTRPKNTQRGCWKRDTHPVWLLLLQCILVFFCARESQAFNKRELNRYTTAVVTCTSNKQKNIDKFPANRT